MLPKLPNIKDIAKIFEVPAAPVLDKTQETIATAKYLIDTVLDEDDEGVAEFNQHEASFSKFDNTLDLMDRGLCPSNAEARNFVISQKEKAQGVLLTSAEQVLNGPFFQGPRVR